jgi:septum formation protein
MNESNQSGQNDQSDININRTNQANRVNRINQKLEEEEGIGFPLLLASASPRRKELLHRLGLKFKVIPSQVEENDVPGLPQEKARTWALLKAEAVVSRHSGIIIGADTIVVLEGRVLGKPRDEQEAKQMLGQLSGNTHTVITGLALINTRSHLRILESVESKVSFRPLSDEEIDTYIATREPMDKAGAYGIQERGAGFVTRVQGCYTNVVGLPVSCLLKSLERILELPQYGPKE